jgi:cell division transport system permease protein
VTRTGGASQSRAGWRHRLAAWVRHHRLSAADSLYRVVDNPGASLLTWLSIGVALALPISLSVLLDSARAMSAGVENPTQISVFLDHGLDAGAGQALAQSLTSVEGVRDARFMSAEEALTEFRELSGFDDVVDSLEENPLPAVVLVEPVADISETAAAQLLERLEGQPGVVQAVLDLEWLERLNRLMALGERFVIGVAVLLVTGVVLILGNTLRLAIESRRDEIVVIKLVGGSDAFVRRPFLYTGLWFGVGGGICAAVLIALGLFYLRAPVEDLAALYGSPFRLRMPGLMGALNVVITGGLLGLAGAWLCVSRHLSRIQPN